MMSSQPGGSAGPLSDPHRTRRFPDELRPLAKEHAGGWVYDIDPAFDRTGGIPREAIIGAWKIADDGTPTDDWVGNLHYRPLEPNPGRGNRRWWIAGALIVALLIVAAVVLFVYPGPLGPGSARVTHASPTGTASHPAAPVAGRNASPPGGARNRSLTPNGGARDARTVSDVHLQVVATAPVWVCLQDASGRKLINGQVISPVGPHPSFVARSFQIVLGNGRAQLRINGVRKTISPSSSPVGYVISGRGLASLPAGQGPSCP
jgi:hypothetical protein